MDISGTVDCGLAITETKNKLTQRMRLQSVARDDIVLQGLAAGFICASGIGEYAKKFGVFSKKIGVFTKIRIMFGAHARKFGVFAKKLGVFATTSSDCSNLGRPQI